MGSFLFQSPRGLALLGLLAPLVLLYVLKIRRRRVVVPSTWLWASARRDLMARSPFQRLATQVPLLLEALALSAAALAFARPVSRSAAALGDHLAIVVDVSASMSASERIGSTTTRLDAAKRAARELVGSMPAGTEIMVVAAGRDAKVASGLERDPERTLAAIDALAVEEVEGDLAPSLGLATSRLSRYAKARVVVLTDGALAHPTSFEGSAIPVDVTTVGAPIDNLGIVRVDVRAGSGALPDGDEVRAFVVLASSSKGPRDVYVTMREDNASDVLASRRVLVPPGGKLPVELAFKPSAGDRGKGLVIDVSPHDAMPLDDVAFARVPDGERLPVALASTNEAPSAWLERALASDPRVELSRGSVADLATSSLDPGALVVIEGACPAEIGGGDVLLVHPPEGPCHGVRVGDVLERPSITSWSESDPRLRFVSFDGVSVSKANALVSDDPKRALVRGREGTLVADASTPGRTTTLVGFDVGESDWPLKASFVLFVRDVIEEARLHRASGVVGASHTGAPIVVPVPASVKRADLTRPGERSEPLTPRGGLVVVPDVGRAGLYRIALDGPSKRSIVVPVSLTSEAESDLGRSIPPSRAASVTVRSIDERPRAIGDHAWIFALVALLFALADVVWLTRRPAGATTISAAPSRAERLVRAAWIVLALLPLALVLLARLGVAVEGRVRFERPWLVALAPVAIFFVQRRLGRAPVGRVRGVLRDALVGGAIFAMSLAVAGLEVGHALDRLTVLVAIDRSRSIDLVPDADALVRGHLAVATTGMRGDDRIGTIAFGAEAAIEDPPHTSRETSSAQTAAVGRDATDLAAAIRRALAEVPADSAARIALVSDGVATRGDTIAAATAALAAEVPIDVVALEQRELPDVRVVSVRGPARGEEGEAIDLRVVTSAPTETDVDVTVKRDDRVISRDTTRIRAGEDVLRIREKLPESGLHRYEVSLSATDPALDASGDDNAGSTFVRVRGEAAALVLEGDAGRSAFVAEAIRRASFRVDEGGLGRVPTDLAGFAAYDLVVLSDIAAPSLSRGQIDALASYVRDFGGGLLLLGGDRSLGPGGFGKTPIEEVSPVSFDIKQEQRRASLAEVIGIDISGSMGMIVGGRTKLDLANEAAARSAALLGPGDWLGVEHVDTEVHWSVQLGPVLDPKAIERSIRSVAVGGGGIIVPITLEAGYAALAGAKADDGKVNLKHMLLFADGDDAEQIEVAVALATPARERGITTSVVALGRGHDVAALEQLSKLGGGRFYLIEDAARLPSVFAQETILAARSSLVEKSFHVARGAGSGATAGIDFDEAPALGGYVVTIPKGRASVLLTGPEGDPILATWPAGIGRAGAFTSDLKDRWGGAWTKWAGAARMVAQTARDLSRKSEDRRVRLESDASGGELHLRATVIGDDGRSDSFRRFTARVGGPDGFSREVALEPTGAGSYAADVPLSRQGTYVAVARDDATGEAVGTTGADLGRGEELRPTGSDVALLARVAAMTGGKKRDTLEGIFADRRTARLGFEAVTPWLVLFGATLWLASVAARRLALPEVVGPLQARLERLVESAMRRPSEPGRERGERLVDELGARVRARRARESEARTGDLASGPASPPNTNERRTEPATATSTATPRATTVIAKEAPTKEAPTKETPTKETPTKDAPTDARPGEAGAKGKSTAELLLAKRRKR